MSNRKLVKELLLQDNFWALNKTIVYAFGLETAFLLSNFTEAEALLADENGWFFQTSKTVEKMTTLNRYKQTQCINQLEEAGILEKDIRGLPAKRYFKLNLDKVAELLINGKKQDSENSGNQYVNNQATSMLKINKLECEKLTMNKEHTNKENTNKKNSNKNKTKTLSGTKSKRQIFNSDLEQTNSNKNNISKNDKNDNVPIETNNQVDPDKKTAKERDLDFLPVAEYLHEIIKKNKGTKQPNHVLRNWAGEVRKLVEYNLVGPPEKSKKRIYTVLEWYAENIGGEYIPVVESGKALREKFTKLESAIERQNKKQKGITGDLSKFKGVKPKRKKYEHLTEVLDLNDL